MAPQPTDAPPGCIRGVKAVGAARRAVPTQREMVVRNRRIAAGIRPLHSSPRRATIALWFGDGIKI
jgi:hypothetical protein